MSPSSRARALLATLALLALAGRPASAQLRAVSPRALDSIAASYVAERRTVGLAAAVVRGQDTLLLEGYGRAVVEWDVPMPVDAMFEIGSVAKQFTAAAVLQLRDAGKLSLDDEITKWLPDFDTRGNRVTLRRLLDHTSGIVGITELPEFAHLVSNPRFPRDSAYALIRRQPFHFPTGTAQSYNNSGFILLGLVIEKASGMTYEEYVEQRIFAPLGMTRSMYCNSLENVPRRAHGYAVQNGALRRGAMNVHTWPYAAGSLCSTAGDLVRWLQALHGGKVLSPASYAEMIAPSTLLDGTPVRYGLGIGVGRDAFGLSYIGHGGAIDGFRAEVNWYPEARLAVVALVNTSGNVDPAVIVGELATAVLPATRPATKPFAGDATPLVGRYRGPSRGREMIVEVTATPQGPAFSVNGSPPRVLPWVEGTTFLGGGAILTFKRAASGPATELRFDGGGGTFYVLKRE